MEGKKEEERMIMEKAVKRERTKGNRQKERARKRVTLS